MTKQFEGFKEVSFEEWDDFNGERICYWEEDGLYHHFIKESTNEFQGKNWVFRVNKDSGIIMFISCSNLNLDYFQLEDIPALELAIKRSKEIRGMK